MKMTISNEEICTFIINEEGTNVVSFSSFLLS